MLEWFGQLQPFLVSLRDLSLPGLVAAAGGALMLLLPAGLKIRWMGVFLLLPLFLPAKSPVVDGMLQLDVFDVGQGTSVAVSTSSHLLLYDTGPGNGAGLDHVSSSIAPVLSELRGEAPDLIVISHGDLDHSGGLQSVRERFPGSPVLGSTRGRAGKVVKCTEGMGWSWDGFRFRVLHPSKGLPYLRNNSSCVLSVRGAESGLLISGDIEGFVENRLVLEGLEEHSMLIVPHHGSKSSSGEAFIDTVAPAAAIATASLGNRFGFPRDEVRARYARSGARFWSTGECGGLRVVMAPGGRLTASSARRERRRIWRWPATKNCP
jgi:competence protein ComEC